MASVHLAGVLKQIHRLFEAGTISWLDRRPAHREVFVNA